MSAGQSTRGKSAALLYALLSLPLFLVLWEPLERPLTYSNAMVVFVAVTVVAVFVLALVSGESRRNDESEL